MVIRVLGDMVDGSPSVTTWQLLYALPPGFGISCCTFDYVTENFDFLRSRYVYVVQGGIIEEKCILAKYSKVAEGAGGVLYCRP